VPIRAANVSGSTGASTSAAPSRSIPLACIAARSLRVSLAWKTIVATSPPERMGHARAKLAVHARRQRGHDAAHADAGDADLLRVHLRPRTRGSPAHAGTSITVCRIPSAALRGVVAQELLVLLVRRAPAP
jgi:hypothetical protein